jgi:pullulanase
MSSPVRKIVQAWLESPTEGLVELVRDWRARHAPPLGLDGRPLAGVERVTDYRFACASGFYVTREGEMVFLLPTAAAAGETVFLAGDFNGWDQAVGREEWRLHAATLNGQIVHLWRGPAERFLHTPPLRFKFVTEGRRWIDVAPGSPNAVRDELGHLNHQIDPERTGLHLFRFQVETPLALDRAHRITWGDGAGGQGVDLRPGDFFHRLGAREPLGALVHGEVTTFRLFAPRATRVQLRLQPPPEAGPEETPLRYEMDRRPDGAEHVGVWEAALDRNLHGWHYWYHLDGPNNAWGHFDFSQPVLDPYALAAVGRAGPGVVVNQGDLAHEFPPFVAPAWQDLVIAEAHVRDLAAHAPVTMDEAERRGFAGLRRWVESPGFYLHELGVNAVELQPVQEFDNERPEDYHWGYMPVNYFAPASAFARDPARASGIRELQELVAAFHRRGIAVILDVVYNHVGVPAHLMFIDKLYYFELGVDGELSNWSGCGNDLRARSTMARRLIIDSCRHLLTTCGVDGFRFDLAELLGRGVLLDIERALKRVKPDVILIAEPWSFRGHIAAELSTTGWASWNDGFRDFARDFVHGRARREAFQYYLQGSPGYYARWPAQSVNYTESHDDRTWIDMITEREDGNGHNPTADDRRRTHLMAALLLAAIGVPMLSAGQDFLRSKHGVGNTYLRGDLNALDYRRLTRYGGTHAYFAGWIAFRRSARGRLLRHYSRPGDGFFGFYYAVESTAVAVVYNAAGSHGAERLLLAFNPTHHDEVIPLPAPWSESAWQLLADHEHFVPADRPREAVNLPAEGLFVPALACGLWVAQV